MVFEIPDLGHVTGNVEIHVRDRQKEGLDRENVDLTFGSPELPGPVGIHGKAPEAVDQQVLQRRGLGIFPADTEGMTTALFSRLFTLITKHRRFSFSGRESTRAIGGILDLRQGGPIVL
jgi:hypothetical protein